MFFNKLNCLLTTPRADNYKTMQFKNLSEKIMNMVFVVYNENLMFGLKCFQRIGCALLR